MQGELIKNILISKDGSWIILQTDKELYSLRLGGFKKTEKNNLFEYDMIKFPLIGKPISKVYTDDFLILIETTEGDALKHAPDASINSKGETSFGVAFLSQDQCSQMKLDYGDLLVELK